MRMTDRLAVDNHPAGVEAVGPEDGARHLGAAGADQPGDAENLAATHGKRHVVENRSVRVLGVAAAGKAFDRERHRSEIAVLAMGEEGVDVATDHLANDAVDRRAGDRTAADLLAVAEHRVAVAKLASPPRGDG